MKNLILFLLLLFTLNQTSKAQILSGIPCYSVANNNGEANVLFKYDPANNNWFLVGNTGTNLIEAIAIDITDGIIYAAEGSGGTNGPNGAFGIIDRTTGNFEKIDATGEANGALGPINLNNINGLAFDPVNQIMYACHKIEGTGPATNDLLFQIDVATGAFVPNAMVNSATGETTDYAQIPEVLNNGATEAIYDIEDIAFNPYTGQIFALHSGQNQGAVISIVSNQTAEVEMEILSLPQNNLAALSFTYLGELLATTGNSNNTSTNDNSFLFIDLYAQETLRLNKLDASNEHTGFKSLDCEVVKNDLALKMTLDALTTLPLQPGDTFTNNISLYNQGEIDNLNITLINYMPTSITLLDTNWINIPNNTAVANLPGPLLPGDSINFTITLKIDEDFQGNTITSATEIVSSFNPNFVDNLNNSMPLPDIDSVPNNQNDEINIVDNEINGRGLAISEDEDDHDIVEISIAASLANMLNLSGFVNEGIYRAQQTLFSNGQLQPSCNIQFEAGSTINLHNGFSVEANTSFDAQIGFTK